jgi:hypothetical protein
MNKEITPIDLANELQRLSHAVTLDLQTKSHMTCLSSLAAMRPLIQLLIDVMSEVINVEKICAQVIETKIAEQPQLDLVGYL